MDVPVLAFKCVRPADGLPLLHSWRLVFKDIIFPGFENWREPLEVIPSDEKTIAGCPLSFAGIQAVKGLGRLSIIWWCILRTYFERDGLTQPEKDSFKRLGSLKMSSP